jgi:glutamyl/glutaminyl-tRNA synthetase
VARLASLVGNPHLSGVSLPQLYRGRLAPSPTGYLHLGHAKTFLVAAGRARAAKGILILRNDDLDRARCRQEYVEAMIEDLRWLGCEWDEGPDVGGPCAPYNQSERLPHYRDVFDRLRTAGLVYPCTCSRRDIQAAAAAPHENGDEPLYPGTCRPENLSKDENERRSRLARDAANWRCRVTDGETLAFTDANFGEQAATAGKDFGDFIVWRREGLPSYQLACVADDAAMQITEVVRGADLMLSTFRQLILYRALGLEAPAFYHCPLVTDDQGVRLAKRHDALALRTLRAKGVDPRSVKG